MVRNKIRVGMIVTVINAKTYGNGAGTTTKVLSKPGALTDNMFKLLGRRYKIGHLTSLVLCEDKRGVQTTTFRNAPAVYEHLADIRPATEVEKAEYRRKSK